MPAKKTDTVFENIKNSLLTIDPIYFCEKYLTLDGKDFRINKNGYKPFSDIYRYIGVKALDKDSKPVIMVKGRQVGATTMASALEMFFVGCGHFGTADKPPIRIVHAFPQLDIAYAYTKTKLNPMISSSKPIDEGKKNISTKSYMQSLVDSTGGDSLQFKQFKGGNYLFIESTGVDGNRLRGKTADVMFFDECQDMAAAAIGNSTKILNKAQYGAIGQGVQVYFGTPKQRNSEYWRMWNKSSQQYYYLGCQDCKKHFPLYTPGTSEWESIWLYEFTVKCTHCGCEQDKRDAAERGKWVALKNIDECDFIGFHINQLYNPEFTKEKIIAEKPENSAINTERAYQNEVLGEFFYGDSSIITADEIRERCGDAGRKFAKAISPGPKVFVGIDIGKKAAIEQLVDNEKSKSRSGGQSYSSVVVLLETSPGVLSIQYAWKFAKNDWESKKSYVRQVMKQYSATLGICDIGYANDFNEVMQSEFGDRFLSSQVMPTVNGKVKFYEDQFPKFIGFEKDFWIEELYEQLRKGNVRFPMGSYEEIAWLIQHCSSMEIKPSVSRTGEVKAHYVKGTMPNDGFMALLNAYLAYKYHITEGFKLKNPATFNRSDVINKPPVVTGFLPRMR